MVSADPGREGRAEPGAQASSERDVAPTGGAGVEWGRGDLREKLIY